MAGNNTGQPSSDTESSPADVFALVGNEIRAEIIRVLGADYEGEGLAFGELRSRLDIEVEPSQLHYHLQQLVGHFVKKTDGIYQLRSAGVRLCLALRAGTFDRKQEQISVDVNFDCYHCQEPVEALFNNGWVKIECSACEYLYGGDLLDFPLKSFEDAAAAFSHFKEYKTLKTFSTARGVCPSCAHQLSPEFQSHEECYCHHTVLIEQVCDICGAPWNLTVGQALLADSELIAFCHDHGVDIFSTPYWELDFPMIGDNVTVRSSDPWEVALKVTFDGDTLELVVDGDLTVVERNRLVSSEEWDKSLLRGIQSGAYCMGRKGSMDMVILPDNEDCLEYLRRQRWPDGVVCPHCESQTTIKKGKTTKDAQNYRCQDCDSSFNDLTGTIFADHQLSLSEMIHIIQEMEEVETAQIARQLDRSYRSVLDFVHEVHNVRDKDPEGEF